MTTTYNPLNEFLLFLIRSIDFLRHKAMESAIRRKLSTVKSEFLFIKENGNGGFDLRNMSLSDIIELHHVCKYQMETTSHHSPLIELLAEKTAQFIWKEK